MYPHLLRPLRVFHRDNCMAQCSAEFRPSNQGRHMTRNAARHDESDMLTTLKSTSARNDTTWLHAEVALYSFEERKKLSWVFRRKCGVLSEFNDGGDVKMRWYGNVAFTNSIHKPHNMIVAPNLVSPLLQCFTFCFHIFSPCNSISTKRWRLQEPVIWCDPFLGEKLVIPTKNTNI